MQIDYICLLRVFLRIGPPFAEFCAREFWYRVGPKIYPTTIRPPLENTAQPEGCATVKDGKPAMTPRRQSKDSHRGPISTFTFRGKSYNSNPRFVCTKRNTGQTKGASRRIWKGDAV